MPASPRPTVSAWEVSPATRIPIRARIGVVPGSVRLAEARVLVGQVRMLRVVRRAVARPVGSRRRGENRFGPEMRAQMELGRKKIKFLADEGAAMLVDCSSQGDGGTLFVQNAAIPGAAGPPMPGQAALRVNGSRSGTRMSPKIPPQIVSPRSITTAWCA